MEAAAERYVPAELDGMYAKRLDAVREMKNTLEAAESEYNISACGIAFASKIFQQVTGIVEENVQNEKAQLFTQEHSLKLFYYLDTRNISSIFREALKLPECKEILPLIERIDSLKGNKLNIVGNTSNRELTTVFFKRCDSFFEVIGAETISKLNRLFHEYQKQNQEFQFAVEWKASDIKDYTATSSFGKKCFGEGANAVFIQAWTEYDAQEELNILSQKVSDLDEKSNTAKPKKVESFWSSLLG